jgi:hypothetical protein
MKNEHVASKKTMMLIVGYWLEIGVATLSLFLPLSALKPLLR